MTTIRKKVDIKIMDQVLLKLLLTQNPKTGKMTFKETKTMKDSHIFFSQTGVFPPHITNEKDRTDRTWGPDWSVEGMMKTVLSAGQENKNGLSSEVMVQVPSSFIWSKIESLMSLDRTVLEHDGQDDPDYSLFNDKQLWDTITYAEYMSRPIPIGFYLDSKGERAILIKTNRGTYEWNFQALVELIGKQGEDMMLSEYINRLSNTMEKEKGE